MGRLSVEIDAERESRLNNSPSLKSGQVSPSYKNKKPTSSSLANHGSGSATTSASTNHMSASLYWLATQGGNIMQEIEKLATTSGGFGKETIAKQVSPKGNTIAHILASYGHPARLEEVLASYGFLGRISNSSGDSPLHVAARAGYLSSVKAICACNGVELRKFNRMGRIALHEALVGGYVLTANFLIEKDPESSFLCSMEGESALFLATKHGLIDVVRQILVHYKGTILEGKSPLHAAIKYDHGGIMREILSVAPDLIHIKDENGRTPVHIAASKGHLSHIHFLLQTSPQSAVERDKYGLFPIHLAAMKGDIEALESCLAYWPHPGEFLDYHGESILHLAAGFGKNELVKHILGKPKFEELINMKDKHGNTPLHTATIQWHPRVVSTLTWDARVDFGVINTKGHTALDAAEMCMRPSPSFREQLTWAALKGAGVPRGPTGEIRIISGGKVTNSFKNNSEDYKDRVNTLLLVSTLVLTVTFAAAFTMPGGYNSSDDPYKGMAVMLDNKWFQVFVLCDTISMYSSFTVAITLIWAQLGDSRLVLNALKLALPLLGISLIMMCLAFIAGMYVVVRKLYWLAVGILVLGFSFVVILSLLFFPLFSSSSSPRPLIWRYVGYYAFNLLLIVSGNGAEDY